VVFLILVVAWAVVLGPSLLRRRIQRPSRDSIGDFHRQLRVLQRAGPTIVQPVHRLDTRLPSTQIAHRPLRGSGTGLLVVRPDAAVPSGSRSEATSHSRRPDPYFHADACKRRRDVLIVLLVTLVGTGVLGMMPVARPLLVVAGVAFCALTAYLVLLVQLSNRARERESKLRYLPGPSDREPMISARRVAAR
jgi:type II secretory pathway component PulM